MLMSWTKWLALAVSSTLATAALGLLPPYRSYLLGIGAGLFVAACWAVIAILNRPEPPRRRNTKDK